MNAKGNNMRGEWNLRNWETEYWRLFFERKIEGLKAGVEKIDLTKEDLCPENVIDILNLLDYEDYDYDTNGWEQDTWISFSKENEDTLMLYYCGRTFKMELMLADQED